MKKGEQLSPCSCRPQGGVPERDTRLQRSRSTGVHYCGAGCIQGGWVGGRGPRVLLARLGDAASSPRSLGTPGGDRETSWPVAGRMEEQDRGREGLCGL
jgi:hypothetical protein